MKKKSDEPNTLVPERIFITLRESECKSDSDGAFYSKMKLFAYDHFQPVFGASPDEVPIQRLRMTSECSTWFAIYFGIHDQ